MKRIHTVTALLGLLAGVGFGQADVTLDHTVQTTLDPTTAMPEKPVVMAWAAQYNGSGINRQELRSSELCLGAPVRIELRLAGGHIDRERISGPAPGSDEYRHEPGSFWMIFSDRSDHVLMHYGPGPMTEYLIGPPLVMVGPRPHDGRSATLNFLMPNQHHLIGMEWYGQALVGGGFMDFTNGVRGVIGTHLLQ